MSWPAALRPDDRVATTTELQAHGVTRARIRHQLDSGHWQRPLPQVIVGHSGPLGARQRWLAALAYGGRGSLLSHRSAAVLLGLRITEHAVEITMPGGRFRPSMEFVQVHQSARPTTRIVRAGLPCSTVARTVVDLACDLRGGDDVRALVSDSVQRGLTTVDALLRESEHSPRHSPQLLRRALEEVLAGTRSAGEAAFLRLIRDAGLPEPEFNATVRTPKGSFVVDVLWREYGVAVEIDGAAWHLNAPSWENDLRRQNLLHISGLLLLRFPVKRLKADRRGVVAETRAALQLRAGTGT